MMKKKFARIEKKLNELAEEGRKVIQHDLDTCPLKDEQITSQLNLAYKLYIQGINGAYSRVCDEFGIPFMEIKQGELH